LDVLRLKIFGFVTVGVHERHSRQAGHAGDQWNDVRANVAAGAEHNHVLASAAAGVMPSGAAGRD
jgi:hypothetical protein